MKLSFVFIFAAFISLQANNSYGQETDITIDLTNETVEHLIDEIESKTEFQFVYQIEDVDLNRRVSLQVKNAKISQILDYIFQNSETAYKLNDRRIYLLKKESKSSGNKDIGEVILKEVEEPLIAIIELYPLAGTVTDASGMTLAFANVIEKGTTNGTQTDVDGNFSLDVSDKDAILVFSYIGYLTKEVPVNGETTFAVTLEEDATKIDEVVVVGYGTTTKEKFNGSVSKIDNRKLNAFSSANFEQALSGTVSGVQVLSNGKNPGDNSVIQIRGISTLTAGSNPLIVVDGNPLTEGSSLSSVNTNDIATINILKDAASASIYGSRASNGVILVTTKKGTSGALKVSYNTYSGVQSRIDGFELADAYDTALFDYDARNFGYISGGAGRNITDDNATRDANGGGKRSRIPTYLQGYVNGTSGLTNTDWLGEVFRDALQQNHHISLSGGDEKSNYAVSLGYLDQENIIVGSDYERFTNNIRFNSKVSDRVKVGINLNTSYSNSNPSGNEGWSQTKLGRGRQADPAFSVVLMQPYYSVYNTDGSLNIAEQINDNNDNWDGPISENTIAHVLESDFTRKEFRLFGNAFVEFEPIDNLTLKSSFGGDYNKSTEEFFAPSTFGNYRTPVANNLTQGAKYDGTRENFIVENTLNYRKAIQKHTFDILLGQSYQEEFRNETDLESLDFADDNIRNVSGATSINAVSRSSKWALDSYFTRLQYDYNNTYTFSASIRRDGSSRFGANTKYGNFGSVSGGWIVSNESFFPEDKFVNYAKLRASWGQTGNNQIGDFGSISLITQDNYVLDGSLTSGVNTSTSPNADLSWETNTATNFGVDLGFLDYKLFLTAEYYITNTTNLLLDVPVPQQTGFSESLQNIGEIENKGFELELRGTSFDLGGGLNLGFNANFSHVNNEVISLGNGQDQIISNATGATFLTKIGESVAEFYHVNTMGVYTSQAQIESDPITPFAGTEIGDYIVEDVNGDGKISLDDRTSQGDFNPDFTYGIGLTLDYKGFDLSAQFTGVEGRKVVDHLVYRAESGEGFFVPTQYYYDNYFNDRNPDGFFRRPDFSSFSSAGRQTFKTDLTVQDGDYFRLRSLKLGYTLSDNIIDKLSIEKLRFYVTGNNIFNLSSYRGYNSEALDTRSNERQSLQRGYVHSASPLTRFVALGLDITF